MPDPTPPLRTPVEGCWIVVVPALRSSLSSPLPLSCTGLHASWSFFQGLSFPSNVLLSLNLSFLSRSLPVLVHVHIIRLSLHTQTDSGGSCPSSPHPRFLENWIHWLNQSNHVPYVILIIFPPFKLSTLSHRSPTTG